MNTSDNSSQQNNDIYISDDEQLDQQKMQDIDNLDQDSEQKIEKQSNLDLEEPESKQSFVEHEIQNYFFDKKKKKNNKMIVEDDSQSQQFEQKIKKKKIIKEAKKQNKKGTKQQKSQFNQKVIQEISDIIIQYLYDHDIDEQKITKKSLRMAINSLKIPNVSDEEVIGLLNIFNPKLYDGQTDILDPELNQEIDKQDLMEIIKLTNFNPQI